MEQARLQFTLEKTGDYHELAALQARLLKLLGRQAATHGLTLGSLLTPAGERRDAWMPATAEALEEFRQRMASPLPEMVANMPHIAQRIRSRAINCFRLEGLRSVGDLIAIGQREASGLRNLGGATMGLLTEMAEVAAPEFTWQTERAPIQLLAQLYRDPRDIPAAYLHAGSPDRPTFRELCQESPTGHYGEEIANAQRIITEVRVAQTELFPES